jgi:serine/threonine protein kinase
VLPTGFELHTGADSCLLFTKEVRMQAWGTSRIVRSIDCPGRIPRPVKAEGKRVCQVCGAVLRNDSDLCPVCALRGALGNELEVTESRFEPTHLASQLRFEHYEVLTREDGTPFELGRGAMGVTYKALDINLRCPVALKVISGRFIGDESARRRFLREARAAASVRHPSVASVFHLGKSRGIYFYAMEFVEGETLGNFIKRSGRLEVKLALEIVTQVAAGLTAIHEQNLIHRDIKPNNIMVSLKDGGCSTAKIIDLGLAKTMNESAFESKISTRGTFAGTPEFASPEQFAGVEVDIRSDLYSLGVVLWQMLCGKLPFNGSLNELMYQHLHTPAPVEQLESVPQPLVVLLEKLLKKDSKQRFRTPNELLQAIPMITSTVKGDANYPTSRVPAPLVRRASSRQNESSAIRAPKRSIAVLPFDTLGRSTRNTYFADGVQDEILSNLARVSQLRVISRTSVMTYRPGGDRDLRSIAGVLGVANVVEGTVRRDGNRVRITIRLVDARRDETLWSEIYDRSLTDILSPTSRAT